jgi:hypothetical protein
MAWSNASLAVFSLNNSRAIASFVALCFAAVAWLLIIEVICSFISLIEFCDHDIAKHSKKKDNIAKKNIEVTKQLVNVK